ncbi:MAG TPA: cytochrome c oxidase subunit 3 [Candidatus Baltobacteraceae bacterium]|nr:cytochrome c oxidase subunit 3 [Candidatus Baltobacteraceae bacterium]
MSAVTQIPAAYEGEWKLPSRGRVAMFGLIIGESAIFTIFVVAYLFYIGKSLSGPTPQQVLEVPIFGTICLLSSSLTIWMAERSIERDNVTGFGAWLGATICLGLVFLGGTAVEWHKLIYRDGLTISTNLFGTTYYSLVGLHATHVIIGLLMLTIVFIFTLTGKVGRRYAERIAVLSMYWHFVDAVWVVVFTVVYIIGR